MNALMGTHVMLTYAVSILQDHTTVSVIQDTQIQVKDV